MLYVFTKHWNRVQTLVGLQFGKEQRYTIRIGISGNDYNGDNKKQQEVDIRLQSKHVRHVMINRADKASVGDQNSE